MKKSYVLLAVVVLMIALATSAFAKGLECKRDVLGNAIPKTTVTNWDKANVGATPGNQWYTDVPSIKEMQSKPALANSCKMNFMMKDVPTQTK